MNKTENPMSPAQAICLAEYVQYAAGSIVSRALVQKPVGSITLFAFDAGQGLNEHTAPYDAYVQILDGESELAIGGQVVNPKCGDTVESLGGLTFTTAATAASAPANYQVSAGGLSSANYMIQLFPGTLRISKASTSTTLVSTPNPSSNRQTVRLSATVAPVAPGAGLPTGSVQFLENGVILGTASLVNGVATKNVSFKRGAHPLTAVYADDTNFMGSSGVRSHQIK